MNHWSDQFIPLRVIPKVLQAPIFNRIRIGLLRFGKPLRLELLPENGIDCVLDDFAWVCIDTRFDDMPLLSWSDFDTFGRVALHSPVTCELRLYHSQSGLIMGTALEAIEQAVEDKLSEGKKSLAVTAIQVKH